MASETTALALKTYQYMVLFDRNTSINMKIAVVAIVCLSKRPVFCAIALLKVYYSPPIDSVRSIMRIMYF